MYQTFQINHSKLNVCLNSLINIACFIEVFVCHFFGLHFLCSELPLVDPLAYSIHLIGAPLKVLTPANILENNWKPESKTNQLKSYLVDDRDLWSLIHPNNGSLTEFQMRNIT